MSDRVTKLLRKMPKKQRMEYIRLIELVLAKKLDGLDVQKLQGHSEVYRVRKGEYRLIFHLTASGETRIIAFERRSDHTYRF